MAIASAQSARKRVSLTADMGRDSFGWTVHCDKSKIYCLDWQGPIQLFTRIWVTDSGGGNLITEVAPFGRGMPAYFKQGGGDDVYYVTVILINPDSAPNNVLLGWGNGGTVLELDSGHVKMSWNMPDGTPFKVNMFVLPDGAPVGTLNEISGPVQSV